MKLCWFITCDKNGVKTDPELRYWDDDIELWRDVPTVTVKPDNGSDYNPFTDEDPHSE